MGNREPQRAHLASDAAARREQILEHQAKRDSMLGKFLLADVADGVFFFGLFQHINDIAAAGFFLAVYITADRLGLLLGFIGNFFRETEIERIYRTSLDAERLLVFANAVAAHGALAGFAGDLVFSNHFPGTGVNAVFAADADILVDDHRAFFVFGDRLDRTYGGAGGEGAVHAAIARPQRRKPFQDRRLHGDPVSC